MTTAPRTRVIDSSRAGHAPGKFQAQYHDPLIDAWFDIGDPEPHRYWAVHKARRYQNDHVTKN